MRSARDRPASSNRISDIDRLLGVAARRRRGPRSVRLRFDRWRGLLRSKPDDDARVKCRSMIEPIAERYRFDPASFDRVV
jgi:hypothetical protein